MVATLQNDTERGTEKFRAMDDALRKKISRRKRERDGVVEHTVTLDREVDTALERLMRFDNVSRSSAITTCILMADNWQRVQWKNIQVRENKLKESRKSLAEKTRSLRKERDEAKSVTGHLN